MQIPLPPARSVQRPIIFTLGPASAASASGVMAANAVKAAKSKAGRRWREIDNVLVSRYSRRGILRKKTLHGWRVVGRAVPIQTAAMP
jgi:hypothetical protein